MRKLLLVFVILALVAGYFYIRLKASDPNRPILWGATFSARYAKELGLDPNETFGALLDDLQIKHFRIPIYWDLAEPERGKFDWTEVDGELSKARAKNADVILAFGVKAPRWPECYYPSWTSGLNDADRKNAILDFVKAAAEHYKSNPAVRYFQVENEPYLPFGNCAHKDEPGLLDSELQAVRSIGGPPIIVTASAIVDPWYPAAKRGDVFGTSMYRRIYGGDRIGYVNYPFGPWFYRAKEKIVRFFLKDKQKKFIVVELSGEPWVKGGSSLDETLQHFNADFFKSTTDFAKASDFDEYYWWGAEWWYKMKTKDKHPEFWDYAKTLFSPK